MDQQFVSEPVKPVAESMDPAAMACGAPGLPQRFVWRGTEFAVGEVLEQWKETGACRHGSAEKYVRKHWFRIRTTSGDEMKLYFERQPRAKHNARWWLFSRAPAAVQENQT